MAVPSPLTASTLALLANVLFFWLAPYLAWKSRPSFTWTLLAKGVALCGLVHHASFYFFQGVNLLLLEGYRPCEFLGAASEHLAPPWLYIRFPTLLWLVGADACGPMVLSAILAFGGLCSLLALLGVAQPLAFLGQYAAVMSLATAGGQVLQYPWDGCGASASGRAAPPGRGGRVCDILAAAQHSEDAEGEVHDTGAVADLEGAGLRAGETITQAATMIGKSYSGCWKVIKKMRVGWTKPSGARQSKVPAAMVEEIFAAAPSTSVRNLAKRLDVSTAIAHKCVCR